MKTRPPFSNLFGSPRKDVDLRVLTLEKVVNLTHELVVVIDPEGKVLSVNPSFLEKTGYKESDVKGEGVGFIRLTNGRDWIEHSLNLVKVGERWHGLLQVRTKDDKILELDSSVSAVFDDDKKLVAYVGVGVDKTREQSISRHLQTMHRLESIGTLVSGIAHRFNNMLAAIMGHTEILGMVAGDNTKVADRVQKILKSTNQAKEFVSQMSAFSKKGDSQKKATDMVPIVRHAVDFIRSATPRAVQIDSQFPEHLSPVMIVSDEINQMLLNLFTNALQSMETCENAKMEVFIEETWKDFPALPGQANGRNVHCVKITVRDNGKGIDPKFHTKVFEPFGMDQQNSQVGMGLAVVHGIVLRHQGHISFDSKVDGGSTFEVYLPILEKELTKDKPEKISSDASEAQERILLVDDEPLITSVGSELLTEMGYRVQAVNHPRQALKLMQERADDFDLIITDLTMPELTGIEMVREIRNMNISVPVVLISGYNERIKRDEAAEVGISEILSKPCPAATLIDSVRKALAGS